MPRVANPPRAQHFSATTPQKQAPQSSLKISIHDDRQEKAARLQSRQALHDLQMNTLKAAASPMRKLAHNNRNTSDSPKTPRSQYARGKENAEDGGLGIVAASAMTPMKRVPILANFEEWMKMATDNKINATNSWNFALIDYFHDMSLLKEGDSVNFQKASCTLDGCVKIYTSRVDSVATETGKLLSGLADSGNKKSGSEEENNGQEGDDGEDEEGVKKKTKRKVQRSSEATLAPSFASLQLKKMELEFSVDPLFKKASADFDEGGAKGLLLNHLTIDANGRIVFDSSDDVEDASSDNEVQIGNENAVENINEKATAESGDDKKLKGPSNIEDTHIASLGSKFFPNLSLLEEQDLCPSLKNFALGDSTGSGEMPFLKAPDDWQQGHKDSQSGGLGDQTGIFLDGDHVEGFDDDDIGLEGFDVDADAGFGDGGEAWAKNAALESQTRLMNVEFDDVNGNGQTEGIEAGAFDPQGDNFAPKLLRGKIGADQDGILSYFDQALHKNWAGPEHWRIRRIKDINKPQAAATSRRKEKEHLVIDFNAPLATNAAETIYTPASSNAAISLPKSQRRSKTRNLLPDDKHFNSKQLLRLFLKPNARMATTRIRIGNARKTRQEEAPSGDVDEAFWARRQQTMQSDSPTADAPQGDYDANFFQDDGVGFADGPPDDDDEFADAKEVLSPHEDGRPTPEVHDPADTQSGAFGTQLVTQNRRVRPEYVQYARVAKKVDVRRLKEEMWKGIGFQDNPPQHASPDPPPSVDSAPLKFTSVMSDLQQVYPKQAMDDISTSYCFICLLHLANEKGLTIDNEPGLEELNIRKDFTAEVSEVDVS
ncbi:uncharacterized protein KY384_009058 [Bacidia gigantensis]|uniref:uncharacterized protein n=1 Tax=Bacidia gigantensis TaxID=2732470 RepID=UPI001D04EDDD|nr:uncharacterized protein KY384_009058 [Bacidia gigantensis]KAG8525414.1 hypothetical protein KY384_009058 [Bacidia gigantensis]